MTATGDWRRLHDSEIASIGDYRCRCAHRDWGAEEVSSFDSIAIVRRGAFSRRFGRRMVVHDCNAAALFSRGQPYHVSHPCDDHDRCTVLAFPRALIHTALDEAGVSRPGDAPFPAPGVPLLAPAFRAHARLWRLLADRAPDRLTIDEASIDLLHHISRSFRDSSPRCESPATRRAHADLAENARHAIAAGLHRRESLADLARTVHASPYHLARVFRAHTGWSLARYRNELRLRAAADRLADGETSLTRLALELGFFDHSHFTNAFTRAFGFPPSSARTHMGTFVQERSPSSR